MALNRWPARAVAGLHYGFLGYLVSGGFLAWRYPRTLPLHFAAAGWGIVVGSSGLPCPLTVSQNRLRIQAGLEPLPVSFLASYVEGRCYPRGRQRSVKLAAGSLVLTSWLGLLRRHETRPAAAG